MSSVLPRPHPPLTLPVPLLLFTLSVCILQRLPEVNKGFLTVQRALASSPPTCQESPQKTEILKIAIPDLKEKRSSRFIQQVFQCPMCARHGARQCRFTIETALPRAGELPN